MRQGDSNSLQNEDAESSNAYLRAFKDVFLLIGWDCLAESIKYGRAIFMQQDQPNSV